MQNNFVVQNKIHVTGHQLYLQPGDICVVNNTPTNNFTVFRSGKIVKTITYPQIAINSLRNEGIIAPVPTETETAPAAPAAPVAQEAPATPAPTEPAPAPTEEAPAQPTEPATEVAEPATEETASSEVPAETKVAPAEDAPVNLSKLNKTELVEHAANVHNIQLDPEQSRKELINAINAAAATKAAPTEPASTEA